MVIPHISHRKFGNVGLLAYLCGVINNSILMCTFNLTMSDSLIETVRPTFKTTETVAQKCNISVFDCFSGEFGGDSDAHEIADELHDSRVFTHNISAF